MDISECLSRIQESGIPVTRTGASSSTGFVVIERRSGEEVWIPYKPGESTDTVVQRVRDHATSGPLVPTHLAHLIA